MASRKPVIHGRDHLEGGADPIPGLSSGGSSFNPPPFQPIPLTAMYDGQFDDKGGHWGPKVDSAALGGLFTNGVVALGGATRTPAINDYFTLPITFGPKGSAWSIFGNWKIQPSGGIFKVTIGTVAETAGELADPATVTYLNPLVLNGNSYSDDTYDPGSSYDGGSNVFSQSFVLGGDDGAAFTAVTGTDANTGYPIIDGGAGTYRFKVQVTGKNAAPGATGYRLDLMNLVWVRANMNGLY